ncbi:hypothetical protein D5S19_15915 [Amycolatopsis panacis]|uniref:Uncharacterized protein n=1 Tax=Amycolatopsis panacis TaxID=2340917 RepID=A0A419I3I4_9PSEU|nr:hypothetical protein D5S19_15915 [Amycolatopsis panacis]
MTSRWEDTVRDAIISLERVKGDWVSLADLREELDMRGTSRAVQEEHLNRMSQSGKVRFGTGGRITWVGKR